MNQISNFLKTNGILFAGVYLINKSDLLNLLNIFRQNSNAKLLSIDFYKIIKNDKTIQYQESLEGIDTSKISLANKFELDQLIETINKLENRFNLVSVHYI